MWTFDFAIDYTMMDKRVITHEHQVTIDELINCNLMLMRNDPLIHHGVINRKIKCPH